MSDSKRGHKLLTEELKDSLPAMYSQDDNPDPMVHVKFFSPYSDWTWFATEYDPESRVFFGLVKGFATELGTFGLDELDEVMVFGDVPGIERDLHWEPKLLSEVKNEL